MTKLEKVIRFVRRKENGTFTWRKFCSTMKCSYPSTETNYLQMLVNAQYVARVAYGRYQVWILPGDGIRYAQLKSESQLKFNSTTDLVMRAQAAHLKAIVVLDGDSK